MFCKYEFSTLSPREGREAWPAVPWWGGRGTHRSGEQLPRHCWCWTQCCWIRFREDSKQILSNCTSDWLLTRIRPDTRCFMTALARLPWIAVWDSLPAAGTLNPVSLTLMSSRKNVTSAKCFWVLLKSEWAKWANTSWDSRTGVCFAAVRNCSSTPASAAYTDFIN